MPFAPVTVAVILRLHEFLSKHHGIGRAVLDAGESSFERQRTDDAVSPILCDLVDSCRSPGGVILVIRTGEQSWVLRGIVNTRRGLKHGNRNRPHISIIRKANRVSSRELLGRPARRATVDLYHREIDISG